MFFVYVLYSKRDNNFYIGYTNDLKRRLREHKAGHTASTKHRKDLELIFWEAYKAKGDAQRRERYFKTTKGKKTLRLMLRESLQ